MAAACGVRARMASGALVEVRAPIVIVAAGTIHTPLLLARSGLRGGSGQLGRNLSLHPATAVFARMDEVVDMARGVPQSFYIDEFAGEGIVFEGVAGPPAYAAMSLPLTGARHSEAMADYRRLAQFGVMVSDSSTPICGASERAWRGCASCSRPRERARSTCPSRTESPRSGRACAT
jgi:hypothetical protein